jgi:Flp pilus assembly secretin CpaC
MLRTLGSLTLLLCIAWSAVAADGTKEKSGKAAPHAIKPGVTPMAEGGTGRMVTVEVLIADIRRSDAEKDGADATLGPKARIEQLDKAGRLDALTRVQLTTADGQKAYIQVGQRVARVTSVTVTPKGPVTSSTRENVGLILGVTPQIRRDGLVAIAINIERSQFGPAEEGPAIWKPTQGDAIRAPAVESLCVQATISVHDGQSVIVGTQETKAQSRRNAVLIVVTPKLLGNEPPSAAK